MSNSVGNQEGVADVRVGLYSQGRAEALELAAAELAGTIVVTIYDPAIAEDRLAFAAICAESEARSGSAQPRSAEQIDREVITHGQKNGFALVVVEHIVHDEGNNFWRLADKIMNGTVSASQS